MIELPDIVLRAYQDNLVAGARAELNSGCKRLVVQSPAGSGKTVTAAYMVRGVVERGMRAMFLVHREELARQASKTFRRFRIPHGYVMASMTMDVRQPVHVAMVDTLRNRLDKVPRPDVLFIDECHHAVSPTWKRIADHYAELGTIIIGLSATPIRLDGRPLSDIFESMVVGPSVKELIAIGALSPYDYFRPPTLLDLTKVKTKYGEYATSDLAEASDRPAIIGDAVEHYKRVLARKRAIAFAVNVQHSRHIADQFNSAGIPAIHVDGETPAAERMAAVSAFERGDIYLMSNVGLFGEGFDVPACEGMIGLRATQSLSLHIQMCGRPMRPHESKDSAVILDHVDNLRRHGLPDADREWSLEGRKKRAGKRAADDDDGPPVAQCPKCYVVHTPAPFCPRCGHEYAKKKELEQVDGQLVKVTEADKEAMAIAARAEVHKARTMEELVAIAERRNYSPKWAKHVFEARMKKAVSRAY